LCATLWFCTYVALNKILRTTYQQLFKTVSVMNMSCVVNRQKIEIILQFFCRLSSTTKLMLLITNVYFGNILFAQWARTYKSYL